MNKANSAKEVLIAARWIIDNVGWCKNTFQKYGKNSNVPVAFCLDGALNNVDASDSLRISAKNLVRNNLPRPFKRNYSGVWVFNDDKKTTKRKVVNFLTEVIKKA